MSNPLFSILQINFLAFVQKAHIELEGRPLDLTQEYISYLVWHIEQMILGKTQNMIINLPGRHLKSFIASICAPAFLLARDPTKKILIVSYSLDVSSELVRKGRQLMEASWYKEICRTRISGVSRSDMFTVKGGGQVQAAAINGVTGKGGDCVILDDPHNVADWNNDRAKAKARESFGLLMSRGDAGRRTQMLLIGHRVADDDLTAHVVERGGFKHLRLPLYAPMRLKRKYDGKTWILEKGEALRRDAFSQAGIEMLRQHHQGPSFWLYYQQGIGKPEEGFEINVDHFPILDNRAYQQLKGSPTVLSVDTTLKTNSTSRNVIHVYAIKDGRYHLIEVLAARCSFDELEFAVRSLARRYLPSYILVEDTARGPLLIERLQSRNVGEVIAITPQGSKQKRLQKCAPLIRSKRVCIRSTDAVEGAIQEIVDFPDAAYDDNVDAMTNFLLWSLDNRGPISRMCLAPPPAPRAYAAASFGSRPMLPSSSSQPKPQGMAIAHGSTFRGHGLQPPRQESPVFEVTGPLDDPTLKRIR